MTKQEIEQILSTLYRELDQVEMANELTACILCNTDTKQEGIEAIHQEIDYYEGQLKEIEEYKSRTINHEKTADMPWLCW